MPTHPIQVVKIGGSLSADPSHLARTLGAMADDTGSACAIVPGGGAFADAVRGAQDALAFDDRLAHRLALDAMTAMAQVLHAIEPRLLLAESVDETAAALARGRTAIWAPRDIRDGHPDIAETWDVTSDSLALWLAGRLRADCCVLMKSVDAPEGIGLEAISRTGLVDRAFPTFAPSFAGRLVLRGPTRDRVIGRGASRRGVAA